MHRRVTGIALLAVALLATACGGSVPEVDAGSDPELFDGRAVWSSQCASCHGASGGGGRGPKLNDGRVLDRFLDPEQQIALVADGRGGMPAFTGRLTDDEIAAVVRYTREVLDDVG